MAPGADICFHCGAGIPAGLKFEEERDGEILAFCCPGCRGAWLLITEAGLDDFYRRRDWSENGIAGEVFDVSFDDAALARYVYSHGGKYAIDIVIGGIRCATCVWLNERMIGRLAGVEDVRVNYATGRARVVFDAAEVAPAAILGRIGELGYIPRPYTVSAAEETASAEKKDLLIRFGTAFFLTMQLMAYSCALYAGYFQGIAPDMKRWMQFFSWLVTTPVIFYSGWPFLRGAWRGIMNATANMELLIAVGALSSYGYSIYATLAGGEVYYETAAMIVTLILAGRLMENAARRRAAGGVERLLSLQAGEATRCTGDVTETVAVADVCTGDILFVRPGERFSVDGRVVEGVTDVDESPATGEPLPVQKGAGETIIAGSLNLTCAIRMVCEKPAAASFIARVARLVEEAQSRRAPIQGVADRAAAFFVPLVVVLAFATFLWHLHGTGETATPLMTALAVIVIACPCALGLATPTAILAGSGAAAAAGVIFKGGDILERLSGITVAVFDKTGTVTCGKPEVVAVVSAPGWCEEDVIALAAAVEAGSLHPLGLAICGYAWDHGIPCQAGGDIRTVAGGGVSGIVGEAPVTVGSARFLASSGVSTGALRLDSPPGGTAVFVAHSGELAGAVVLQDRLREEGAATIAGLQESGVATFLLSGDRPGTVRFIADALGIGEAAGDMSPAGKAEYLDRMRQKGETVLMVGDGINDAPALSSADVGCAIAGGTDIALDTSDLILAKPDLKRLLFAHRLARRTMAVVRQNLGWALIYNLIGIPLAMTGRLTPIYAAAAMAASSLCVVWNSLRLTKVKYE